MRTVRSAPAAATELPSPLYAAAQRLSFDSVIARCSSALFNGQRRMLPSSLPEAICLPSGRIATALTNWMCPWRTRSSFPVATSHTMTALSLLAERVVSPEPEISVAPSLDTARLLIVDVCPSNFRTTLAAAKPGMPSGPAVNLIFLSCPAVNTPAPSRVKARVFVGPPSVTPIERVTFGFLPIASIPKTIKSPARLTVPTALSVGE